MRDGRQVAFERRLYGNYSDPAKATNTLRKALGDTFITITDVATESNYYSIPIEDFVDAAIGYGMNDRPVSEREIEND